MTIHNCPLVWQTGEFQSPPEFGPEGGAHHKCDSSNIHHFGNIACTDEIHPFNTDFPFSSHHVRVNKIYSICNMILWRIHPTCSDPLMVQPHNNQENLHEDFLDYVPERLIKQCNIAFYWHSIYVAAIGASRRFPANLPMSQSAIASSSSQHIPCSDINNNDITKITRVGNMGLVERSTIVEGVMSAGG